MNSENLELEIASLKKENELLQSEVEKDVQTQADLIIKNKELELENQKLKEENDKLKKDVEVTENMALELADNLYKKAFIKEDGENE